MVRIRESISGVHVQGTKLGRWEFVGPAFSVGAKHWRAVAQCECGKFVAVDVKSTIRKQSNGCKSCSIGERSTTHGEARRGLATRLYRIWAGIKKRCFDQSSGNYHRYGGRGISMCQQWLEYEPFRDWSISNGYDATKEIDRHPNNDGDYEPTNCRWVTHKRNCRNTSRTRFVSAFGETKSIQDWSEDSRCAVATCTLRQRLKIGWSAETAITTKARGK